MWTAAADHVGAAVFAHVARSVRSHHDAVICIWKRLYGLKDTLKNYLIYVV